MRVAITADVHLSSTAPERLQSFERTLEEILAREIRVLIVAGDLFDQGYGGHREVDRLARSHPRLQLIAVPGNHDRTLRQAQFGSPNVKIFSEPALARLEGRPFLFLPYREGKTMGGAIEESGLAASLPPGRWVLIGHGDFGGRGGDTGGEAGYFPLSRRDLLRYRPARVILGHLHAPSATDAEVISPGSPYPRSADEWGQRRLLVLDTGTAQVESLPLRHPPVYLRAELFLVPDGQEAGQIRSALAEFLREQEGRCGGEELRSRLRLTLVLSGYAVTREGIEAAARAAAEEEGVRAERVDLDALGVSGDQELAAVARRVSERVRSLELAYPELPELRAAVLRRAYAMVYGA